MQKESKATKEELISKRLILVEAREQLKKEFFGIDNIIDKVMDTIQTWYLLPFMQERPTIINLWGLTGVGKTALVKRISQLIRFNKKFYHFDLGESSDTDWKMKHTFRDLYEYENGFPCIICLDEFQHGYSLNPLGEVERPSSRVMWDLLDHGKFQYTYFSHFLEEITRLRRKLQALDSCKIKVENGIVVQGLEYFLAKTEADYYSKKKSGEPLDNHEGLLVPERFHESLLHLASAKYNSVIQIRELLTQLDFIGSLNFLNQALELGYAPREVDCTKALIFVLGNLDEVYRMSGALCPDINADEYRKSTDKITISHIKYALQKRFRNEQIARLGNNHFIYPALGSADFRKIIAVELEKYTEIFQLEYGMNLFFDSSVEDVIYQEGVFPSQGTRPVFTTIQQLVGSRLGNILSHQLIHSLRTDYIHVVYKDVKLHISFCFEDNILEVLQIPVNLTLIPLRMNKGDDGQAIVAVHESGHAVLSVVLKKKIPSVVYSVSADAESKGFIYIDKQFHLHTRLELMNHLAFLLGGMAAEKIIFGNENVTIGSESDIQEATRYAARMIRDVGMGITIGTIKSESPETDECIHNNTSNDEIKDLLSLAMKLAENTLTEHKSFLIELSRILVQKTNMQEAEIEQIVKRRGLDGYLKRDFSPLDVLRKLEASQQRQLFSEEAISLNYLHQNIKTKP